MSIISKNLGNADRRIIDKNLLFADNTGIWEIINKVHR